MQINPNSNIGPIPSSRPSSPQPREVQAPTDGVAFGDTESLNLALSEVPESRNDKVESAKKLIADATYPPPETIRKIADLLAANLFIDPK